MRNPLLFSSDLLVKRALEAYDAPYKDVLSDKNKKSVQDFWTNLQSYPQEVQRQVYEQMAGIKAPGNTYGGALGALGHAATQTYHGIGDFLGRGGNYVAKLWGGGRQDLAGDAGGLDTSERRRDSAKRVYNLAMQDPQYMSRLQAALPQYENMATNQAAEIRAKLGDPTPPPYTPPSTAPTPAPAPPAPVQPNTPTPVATQPTAPAPVTAQPSPPAPVQAQTTPSLVSAPAGRQGMRAQRQQLRQDMRDFRQQRRQALGLGQNNQQMTPAAQPIAQTATPAPKKEGLIEGIPASQWIAQNKARQQQTMPAVSAKPSGMIYDSVSGKMVSPNFNRYK